MLALSTLWGHISYVLFCTLNVQVLSSEIAKELRHANKNLFVLSLLINLIPMKTAGDEIEYFI